MNDRSRILVIDDDISVRLRLAELLTANGDFSVEEADNGTDGLRLVTEFAPDLVLLDLMMPGLTGLEVCTQVRQNPRSREVPIIVLSAADESDAMIAALDAGADDYLRKPFSSAELRAKVRTITRLNRFRGLAGERDRFRWLLDHSLEPLVIVDGDGLLVRANARAQEVFGLPAEPAGQDRIELAAVVSQHFRADPPDAWAAWREGRLPTGTAFAIYQPETPQVAPRWFEVERQALDGTSAQTLLKFTNRSGLVRRELETFTFQSLISHKIRTPLNGLGPILSFLEECGSFEGDPDVSEMLRLARKSAERLEETLLSILRHHEAVFQPDRGAAPAALQSLAEVAQSAAQAAGLAANLTWAGPRCSVAHAAVLEVVFHELLGNYAKFSEAPRHGLNVDVRPAADGSGEIRLFAPGVGLPPDVVAQLGRPFWQLEGRFSGEVPGMGLGLATARMLLRNVGGDLTFANRAAPAGIVSTVFLPAGSLQVDLVHAN